MKVSSSFFVLVALVFATSAASAPPPWAHAHSQAVAFTGHQTQILGNGDTITFTISTEGPPASGAGTDLGTFGPGDKRDARAPGRSGIAHGGKLVDPAAPARGLAASRRASDCGESWAWGQVTYDNYLGVNLFTYDGIVGWSYCDWTVQSISGPWAYSESSCCGWSFEGNDTVSDSGAGDSNFQAFASATYKFCLLWWCNTRSPWLVLQGNGAGNLTGFWWGV